MASPPGSTTRAARWTATRRRDRRPTAAGRAVRRGRRRGRAGLSPTRLGLPVGTPVVIGAGDRACEVLGTGATETRPLVSWGTTANVSVPVAAPTRPDPPRRGGVPGGRVPGGCSKQGCRLPARSSTGWCRLTGASPADTRRARRDEPAGCPGGRGDPVARGRPSAVVAAVRGGRPRRASRRHTGGRTWPARSSRRSDGRCGAAWPRSPKAPTTGPGEPPSSHSVERGRRSRVGRGGHRHHRPRRRAGDDRDRRLRRAPRSSPPGAPGSSGISTSSTRLGARRPMRIPMRLCGDTPSSPTGRTTWPKPSSKSRRPRQSRVLPAGRRTGTRAPETERKVRVRARCPSRCCSTSRSPTNC